MASSEKVTCEYVVGSEEPVRMNEFDGLSCGQWCPTKLYGFEMMLTIINNESLLLIVVVIDYIESC